MIIRRATPSDARTIAEFTHDIRNDSVPLVHSIDDVENFVLDHRISRGSSWVVEESGEVLGWLDVAGDDLDQLYLKRGHQGRGLGKALLDHAKSLSPGRLELYTFQVNTGARRFYQREGFTEIYWGDGGDNEEGQPDVKLEWRSD
jgi:GNAT superfamily N-acetyltransferase